MINYNINHFSYNLWGIPSFFDGHKFLMDINPKYGSGNMIGLAFDTGLRVSLAKYKIRFKLEKPIFQYKEDLFYMGKVLKGQYFIKENENNSLLFNEGDIFCFLGNYFLNPQNHSVEETEVIGIFGYKGEVIEAFIKRKWYTDKIKKIFNDSDLKKGIVLSKTAELENIIDSLHIALTDDDRLRAYVKSMDLFYYFLVNYNKKMYTKSKTYTEEQVDTVIKIKQFLDEHLDTYYTMPKIAAMFNISLSRMQSIFRDYYKLSPYRYHLNARLERANELILGTDMKIDSISKSVGFSSYNKFFKAYKEKYHCNPSKHRIS